MKNEIIEYLKLERQVRIDGFRIMDKRNAIPKRIGNEIKRLDKMIEYLVNGDSTSDKLALHKHIVIKAEGDLFPFDYWKERCKLLESIEEESPCDPDITATQIEAWNKYHDFIKKHGKGNDF